MYLAPHSLLILGLSRTLSLHQTNKIEDAFEDPIHCLSNTFSIETTIANLVKLKHDTK